MEKRRLENLQELERRFKPADKPAAKAEETASKKDFSARKAVSREEKKMRSRAGFLENEIGKLEAKLKKMEGTLANPGPGDDIMELTRQYLEDKRDLDAKTDEWSEIMEKLGD